jgi:hypothetical protein
MSRERDRQNARLLNVAKALRDAAEAKKFFCMRDIAIVRDDCGTPACALGHYAARRDLQATFELSFEERDADHPLQFEGFFPSRIIFPPLLSEGRFASTLA